MSPRACLHACQGALALMQQRSHDAAMHIQAANVAINFIIHALVNQWTVVKFRLTGSLACQWGILANKCVEVASRTIELLFLPLACQR